MKTIKNLLSFLLVVLFFSTISCEKENLAENNTNLVSNQKIKFIQNGSSTSRTSSVNGMLEFDDTATFLSTIEMLAKQAEDHDDAFVNKYDYLNDDDLEAKEIEIGHDVHQPFIDFENQFSGFTSLRKDIRTEQDRLIQSELLNDSNDPDNHYVFDDEIRTVLNEKAQVKIGKSLFQMTRFGYVEITDGDFNTLAIVESSDASQLNLPNVVVNGGYYGSSSANNNNPPGTPTDCRTDYDETNYKTTSSNRRIKGIQKLKGYSSLWGSKIKAKTKYQKKRWWGGWTAKRTRINAKIYEESVNRYCELPAYQDRSKTKRGKKVKVTISSPSSNVFKTKYHKLSTIHKKIGNSNIIDDYFYE